MAWDDSPRLECATGSLSLALDSAILRVGRPPGFYGQRASIRVVWDAKLVMPEDAMTVTLELPPQIESAYLAEAQARGLSLDDVVREVVIAGHPKAVFEQELGMFGSSQDAALLDEVVAVAYDDRKRAATPASDTVSRQEASRRMLVFGEKYHLSLGEPVTRELLHEGHRF